MGRVDELVDEVVSRARGYEFKTFGLGLSMPEGVQEREDEIRSSLKLKGRETVKTELAKLMSAEMERKLGKELDRADPDLMATVDVANVGVALHSRPLFFYARYSKPRGIAQKRERCDKCSGRGCGVCRMTGFKKTATVEFGVGRRLLDETGAEAAKFSWIGSEDKESKVAAPGRPFVAELKNPKRRRIPRAFVVRAGRRKVRVSNGRLLPSRPFSLPRFKFRTLIAARSSTKVSEEQLKELGRKLRSAEVVFDRPNERPVSRRVYRVAARARGKDITIDAVLDGGLPVKRFVSGELVSPSVSEVLKTEVRCRAFDICGVRETGKFGFGEISRLQAKN